MARENVQHRTYPGGTERWIARWRDAEGKQHEQRFHTKQAAQKFQAERRADRLRGLQRDEDKAKDSFAAYSDKWLAMKRTDVRSRTLDGYEKDLRVHILPVFGSQPVGKITRSHVISWVESMKEKRIAGHGLSPRTIKAAHKRLEQVLSLAVLDGAIYFNAATGVTLPRLHAEAPEKPFKWRILSPADQSLLVAAMEDRKSEVVTATLLGTGLRASELAGLEIGDVNLKRRTVRIERTKRFRAGELITAEPKTEHSTRVVPLRSDLAQGLGDWIDSHLLCDDPRAPLFPLSVEEWKRPINMDVFRRVSFWPAVRAAGLDPALRMHDLRHTYGTGLVEAGTPIDRVSRMMGHSSIQVTMLYAHHNTAQYHDEVEALPPLLTPKRSRLEVVPA